LRAIALVGKAARRGGRRRAELPDAPGTVERMMELLRELERIGAGGTVDERLH
jgi:hypothetical protein